MNETEKRNDNERLDLEFKKILSVEEACILLSFKKSYLYKLTSKNQIPFYKPNNKRIYFLRSELQEWLLKNRYASNQEISDRSNKYLTDNRK